MDLLAFRPSIMIRAKNIYSQPTEFDTLSTEMYCSSNSTNIPDTGDLAIVSHVWLSMCAQFWKVFLCIYIKVPFQILSQSNFKLDEERGMLMLQLQSLMNQNQDLLTQIINSKDQFAEEQKTYLLVHSLAFQSVFFIDW